MWPHCDQYHTSCHTSLSKSIIKIKIKKIKEQENKVKSITYNSDTKQGNISIILS